MVRGHYSTNYTFLYHVNKYQYLHCKVHCKTASITIHAHHRAICTGKEFNCILFVFYMKHMNNFFISIYILLDSWNINVNHQIINQYSIIFADYWSNSCGMKIYSQDNKSAVLGYDDNQVQTKHWNKRKLFRFISTQTLF